MVKLFYFILVITLLTSCSKGHRCDCFVSNGSEIEEIRPLNEFTELEINNVFEITLKIDTINKIKIITGKNLIKGIETVVENNRLFITESFSPIRPPKRYLNQYGQLLEHSPYCERDIKLPELKETFDQTGDFKVLIKKEEVKI